MNHCRFQQKNAFDSSSDQKDPVFCPKPRRLSQFSTTNVIRPHSWQLSNHRSGHCEWSESKPGAEVLENILTKARFGGADQQPGNPDASSPPFYRGSPPSRSANPIVQDARFAEEKPQLLTGLPAANPSGKLISPSTCGAGCVRSKFGPKPAAVRIEGFDCHRDGRNRSIPAVA